MSKRLLLTLFFIVHISLFYYVYPVKIIETASKGHWEPILTGFLTELAFMWMYLKGLSRFPDKDVIGVYRQKSGKWLSAVLLVPLAIFLFLDLNLIHRYEYESVNVLLLPKTPTLFILLLYSIPCYIAWKGIEAIARGGVALFICVAPLILFSLVSGVKNMDIHNIFPLFDAQLSYLKRPAFYASLFPHAGFLFLGLMPKKSKPAPLQLSYLLAVLFIFGLASVYLPMLIFGPEAILSFRYPNVLTLDTVDNEWVVFDWLPTFFVISMIGVSMVESAVSLWVITTLIQRLLLPVGRGWIVIALGLLSYGFSAFIPNMDSLEQLVTMNSVFCVYSICVVPVTVWLMSLHDRRNPA
ncbi:GerAB/ArcD/ProY family transporter [Paenibacillus doosanensis]|uniref:GerAB/ArcD/ProY family transporter n=1 Tax=Paenibacillus doosanensis TaxID=1229154 RepID=UPI00217FFDD1|nr:GerAB/ArcD/ProY family transporter [Paenibacillus doosanensis]MCS7460505.1 GerAB/ArcD/ProY family transporter [Paenibacillus doosanensis]